MELKFSPMNSIIHVRNGFDPSDSKAFNTAWYSLTHFQDTALC